MPWYRSVVSPITLLTSAILLLSACGGGSSKPSQQTPESEPPSAAKSVTEYGFLTARDGTRLRYSVIRPESSEPVAAVINYEGYGAGSNPADNGMFRYQAELLERGYALVGVSVRGTGCSEGDFNPFVREIGTDGYDAVEAIAAMPWSDGRIGMIGVSFGGITQLATAAEQPPHLRAIVPSSATSDLYRDVAYPGGILEYSFVALWTAIQKQGYFGGLLDAVLVGETSDLSEPECAAIYAQHEADNANQGNIVLTMAANNPFIDDRNNPTATAWDERSLRPQFKDVRVPTLLFNTWQDEQLPARILESLSLFPEPELLWANITNGDHGRDLDSIEDKAELLDFLDRFVADVDNGFELRYAKLTLPMETATTDAQGNINVPAWKIERDSVADLDTVPHIFYLRSDNALNLESATGLEAGDSYLYPLPSSDVLEYGTPLAGNTTGQWTWKTPVPPGGAQAYSSEPLSADLVVAGSASLDLWVTTTSTDVDFQATITEIRPDGQELYIQRGWLRASHRKLDPELSTILRPYQTHLRADASPLLPGQPTFMRLEIFPFAHAFRAGSRVRIWIEAPTGHTGFWGFNFNPEPSQVTVLHDAEHPSRLVLGRLEQEVAAVPLPACDSLRSQPCRPDPLAD